VCADQKACRKSRKFAGPNASTFGLGSGRTKDAYRSAGAVRQTLFPTRQRCVARRGKESVQLFAGRFAARPSSTQRRGWLIRSRNQRLGTPHPKSVVPLVDETAVPPALALRDRSRRPDTLTRV